MARLYGRPVDSVAALNKRAWHNGPVLETVDVYCSDDKSVKEYTYPFYWRKSTQTLTRARSTWIAETIHYHDGTWMLEWLCEDTDTQCTDRSTLPLTTIIPQDIEASHIRTRLCKSYVSEWRRREHYVVLGTKQRVGWLTRDERARVREFALRIVLVANRVASQQKLPKLPLEMWYMIASMLSFHDVLQ